MLLLVKTIQCRFATTKKQTRGSSFTLQMPSIKEQRPFSFAQLIQTSLSSSLVCSLLLLSKCSDIDIWVAFGSGKNFQNFSINKICGSLGQARCTALPMYHAFSGCDTTSQFLGKGKKSSWEAWNAFPEVTDAFLFLAEHPFEQIDSSSDIFKLLERSGMFVFCMTRQA